MQRKGKTWQTLKNHLIWSPKWLINSTTSGIVTNPLSSFAQTNAPTLSPQGALRKTTHSDSLICGCLERNKTLFAWKDSFSLLFVLGSNTAIMHPLALESKRALWSHRFWCQVSGLDCRACDKRPGPQLKRPLTQLALASLEGFHWGRHQQTS